MATVEEVFAGVLSDLDGKRRVLSHARPPEIRNTINQSAITTPITTIKAVIPSTAKLRPNCCTGAAAVDALRWTRTSNRVPLSPLFCPSPWLWLGKRTGSVAAIQKPA
jgi:hypothetical protein